LIFKPLKTKMKNYLTILSALILLPLNTINAQRNSDKDNVALIMGISPTLASIPRTNDGLSSLMVGGKIGALFYDRKDEFTFPAWSFGIYGSFLTPLAELDHVKNNNISVEYSKMNLRDAGIFFEVVPVKIGKDKLFESSSPQFFVSVPLNWGLLSEVRLYDYNPESQEKTLLEKSNFMKIEPGINLNLTLSKFAILTCGVSYQWTYLWDKPLENIQEWPDLGILKINLCFGARINLFQ
jgi:hypothetical protein